MSLVFIAAPVVCSKQSVAAGWSLAVCPSVDSGFAVPSVILGCSTLVPEIAAFVAGYLDDRKCGHKLGSNPSKGEGLPLLRQECDAATYYPLDENYFRIQMYLYGSHFLSAWSDRMWAFAIPILLMEIFVDTLMPSALFSLATYIASLIFMPTVGEW